MKIIKSFKAIVIALSLFALPLVSVAQTVLPEVVVRCTRYSGSFSVGDHYFEWVLVLCDNPEANDYWVDVFVAA